MTTRRRFACLLLLTAHATLRAQSAPPPLPPMPPPLAAPPAPAAPAGLVAPALLDPGAVSEQPVQPIPPPPPAPLVPPSSAAALRNADLPTVAIREFRSSVGEVASRGATDMFIAALVRSRKFRVLERARLVEGIGGEKALNQQGLSTGEVGRSQFLGVTYLFEATISEASAGDRSSSFTFGVAGAAASKGSSTDSIAIDVRVTDVDSGVIVDAVTVRKDIQSVETKVAGITSALANLFSKGRAGAAAQALAPDERYVDTRKDSVDRTLRLAIDEAVAELAKRVGPR